jgi:hypothetical protein
VTPLSFLRRALLTAVGLISVAVGTIGIFVPLLPTTVFLLLAAACFIRSSDRLYSWLTTNRVFGSYIRNYQEHRAMPAGAKRCAIAVLWLTIGVSAAVVEVAAVRAVLLLVAVGVTILVSRIRTLDRVRDDESPGRGRVRIGEEA